MEKNKKMMTVIIALLVVLIGIIGGLGVYIVKNVKGDSEVESTVVTSNAIDQKDVLTAIAIESITTNLAEGTDKDQNHMIKIGISVDINAAKEFKKDSKEIASLLAVKEMAIKDIVIEVVSSKTFEELRQIDAKAIVKEEILRLLQDEFKSNIIVSIKISEWTVM